MNELNLTIEPGKHYRTRDGHRARVYAVDGNYGGLIHGALLGAKGWTIDVWHSNGRCFETSQSELDLIAPWVDLPEVDWSKLPEFITCVTVDADGEAWAWACAPEAVVSNTSEWNCRGLSTMRAGYRLFPGTVKFTGDWRQSKVRRPEVSK